MSSPPTSSSSPVSFEMNASSSNSSSLNHNDDTAWDLNTEPEIGPTYQPWRAHWPPSKKILSKLSPGDRQTRPWIEWKRDPSKLNYKPWYYWFNVFNGDIDQPCDRRCENCGGKGCGVCSTVAKGG